MEQKQVFFSSLLFLSFVILLLHGCTSSCSPNDIGCWMIGWLLLTLNQWKQCRSNQVLFCWLLLSWNQVSPKGRGGAEEFQHFFLKRKPSKQCFRPLCLIFVMVFLIHYQRTLLLGLLCFFWFAMKSLKLFVCLFVCFGQNEELGLQFHP